MADRFAMHRSAVLDDFVVRRADGVPAYHVAVVVDDADWGVDEVVRGRDLLDITPRQVWLGPKAGAPDTGLRTRPAGLGTDGHRLAKHNGAVTRSDLEAQGVDSPALVAALATGLGLSSSSRPARTAGDLLAAFDPDAVPRVPWAFDAGPLVAAIAARPPA